MVGTLASRLLVALPRIALFISVVLLNITPLAVGFFSLIAALAGGEAASLLKPGISRSMKVLFAGFTGLAAAAVSIRTAVPPMPLLLSAGGLLAVILVLRYGVEGAGRYAAGTMGAVAVISGGFALLGRLRTDFPSPWVIFIPLLICWLGDTLAYFVGSAAGRHKMAPSISPAKSWEGFAAGLAGSVAGAVLAGSLGAGFSAVAMVITGLLGGCAAVAGDLLESALKRNAGVKDSGSLLGGHGGVLDRFDSVLAVVPVVWVLLTLFSDSGLL